VPKSFPTVAAYLKALPPERRAVIAATRKLVTKHLPAGYVERQNGGFISYEIPLADYPATHNKQPLCYVGLAAQKNHYALYLVGCYMSEEQRARLQAAYKAAKRPLDMGKSCLRFGAYEDLHEAVIGELIAAMKPADFIATYEQSRDKRAKRSFASCGARPRLAGPLMTAPNASKREPWHLQSHDLAAVFQLTGHPRCGQTADISCSSPAGSR
jgi:hypothetical protein